MEITSEASAALAAALAAALLAPSGALAHGGGFERPRDVTDHSVARVQQGHAERIAPRAIVQRRSLTRSLSEPITLPRKWCGDLTATKTDDIKHAFKPEQPAIKLVYAHPADTPSDFERQADAMQASVSDLSLYVANATDGQKTIRFDMGTSCGKEYVDIQVVQLPFKRSYYQGTDGRASFDQVAQEVLDIVRFDPRSGFRTVAIWADYMALDDDPALAWGTATVGGPVPPVSWVPARSQSRDLFGGRASAAALFMGFGSKPTATPYGDPKLLLHEVTHTMGAVPDTSPHATDYGHCWQNADPMCYDDGGLPKGQGMADDCPVKSDFPTLFEETYDCGRDDYFRPMPGVDKTKRQGVNVFDNLQMQPCADLPLACGGKVTPLPDGDRDTAPDAYDLCPTKAGPNTTAAHGCPYRARGVVTLPVTGTRAPAATMRGELKGTLATWSLSARSLPAGSWKLIACAREERGRQNTSPPSGAGCQTKAFTLKRPAGAAFSGSVRISSQASGVRYTAAVLNARGQVVSRSPLDLGVGGVDALY